MNRFSSRPVRGRVVFAANALPIALRQALQRAQPSVVAAQFDHEAMPCNAAARAGAEVTPERLRYRSALHKTRGPRATQQ